MEESNLKILVLSSVSPSVGPAIIGGQIYDALKQKGLDVDFMTKFSDSDHPEYLWVIKNTLLNRLYYKIKNKIMWLRLGRVPDFYYANESRPPVSSPLVLKAIKKKHDLVYIVFWQGLLSFDTVEKIFDKIQCQFQFQGVDYSHMAGGCHFIGDCQRYQVGCGKCPAFHSNNANDFTAKNVVFRKRVYEKVKPIVYGNLYMKDFYKSSYLLKDARVEMTSAIINTDVFRPLESIIYRKKYVIPDEKKFVIFFGSQNLNSARKGIYYLLEAFNYLYQHMGESVSKVLVITAGRQYDLIKNNIPFDSRGFGYVPMDVLPEIFSLATLFVCSSVNDAGPMMVNQSICCGTPVVGFDMGAVKQVVKDKGTGVCVPIGDSKALAEGMLRILKLTKNEYNEMSSRARELGIQTSSYGAQADLILRTYKKYQ